MRQSTTSRLATITVAWFVTIFTAFPSTQAAETETLTSAAQVRALPAAVAESKIPAKIRGVVTAAEPDWQGKFVIQDDSSGSCVQNVGEQPRIGDYIEVSGWTGKTSTVLVPRGHQLACGTSRAKRQYTATNTRAIATAANWLVASERLVAQTSGANTATRAAPPVEIKLWHDAASPRCSGKRSSASSVNVGNASAMPNE